MSAIIIANIVVSMFNVALTIAVYACMGAHYFPRFLMEAPIWGVICIFVACDIGLWFIIYSVNA